MLLQDTDDGEESFYNTRKPECCAIKNQLVQKVSIAKMRIFRWMNDNKSHLQELASVDDQSELLEMVWTCENVDEMRAPIRSDMMVVNKGQDWRQTQMKMRSCNRKKKNL